MEIVITDGSEEASQADTQLGEFILKINRNGGGTEGLIKFIEDGFEDEDIPDVLNLRQSMNDLRNLWEEFEEVSDEMFRAMKY